MGALRLGAALDAEPNGVSSPNATADDINGVDDEDGIRFATPIYVSATTVNRASIVVVASGTGKLDGWIDFNRDGDWDDTGEQILLSSGVALGSQRKFWSVLCPIQAVDFWLLGTNGGCNRRRGGRL